MGVQERAAKVLGGVHEKGPPKPGRRSLPFRGDRPEPPSPAPERALACSPYTEEATALLTLADAFRLLSKVVDREYETYRRARNSQAPGEINPEATRLSYLIAKHLDTFTKLVKLAREGHFDLRELEPQEQPRLPDFDRIPDEKQRGELVGRYRGLLEQEQQLLDLVESFCTDAASALP